MAQTTTIPVGSASLILNGRSYTNFGEGDTLELTFVNNKAERTIGEGGVVNINERVDANEAELVVRFMRRSDDDIALSALTNTKPLTVLAGSLVENYVTDTKTGLETYTLTSGNIMKHTEKMINNQEGKAMVEYTIACQAERSI